ncbi:MAG TPA: DUF2911 domain-containing protein [Sphingobacteriaceae bacterium]|nr:DUF2911 domain-containing protein [Sphingobacteriaceae bacterium]
MKKLFLFTLIICLLAGVTASAQREKTKRVSAPAKLSVITKKGITISIDYSRPAVKGRIIGKDIAPYGKIWRTGANEASVFEISRDAKIQGHALAAGKYSLYTIPGEKEWTIIFNKDWKQWGTIYKDGSDALRVKAKASTVSSFAENLTFTIAENGSVALLWGNSKVEFKVK